MTRRTYRPPTVTVDTVVLSAPDDELHVLLVERSAEPFQGREALPGVYVAEGETIFDASTRCLTAKADLHLPNGTVREIVTVFDSIDRDPRGHALSVVVVALTPALHATSGRWVPVTETLQLPFDHPAVIQKAVQWTCNHLWSTPQVFAGLTNPGETSTARIADVVTAVTGEDARQKGTSNLRRKIAASGLFERSEEPVHTGSRGHPPMGWRLIVDRPAQSALAAHI
jgi:8-oxo-dGTP diphosphatase